MKTNNLTKLAVAGLLSTAMGTSVFANSPVLEKERHSCNSSKADQKHSCASKDKSKALSAKFKSVHDCKGLNVCKGLGGCAVSKKELEAMAKAIGVDPEKAGEAHGCAGLNECKGLGGCKVSEAKFKKLKAKQLKKKAADTPSR